MREFKITPVRRLAPARPFSDRYLPAPDIIRNWDKFEKQVVPETVVKHHDPYLRELARCEVWGGKIDRSGWGYFYSNGRMRTVQSFAYEYHFGLIPRTDPANFGESPVKLVPRCVAAGTKHCVAKDHLSLIHAWENYCKQTTPELRTSLRNQYYRAASEDLTLELLASRNRMIPARLARILIGMEGGQDPGLITTPLPVDKVG